MEAILGFGGLILVVGSAMAATYRKEGTKKIKKAVNSAGKSIKSFVW